MTSSRLEIGGAAQVNTGGRVCGVPEPQPQPSEQRQGHHEVHDTQNFGYYGGMMVQTVRDHRRLLT